MTLSFFSFLFSSVMVQLCFTITSSNGNIIEDLKKEIKEQQDLQEILIAETEELQRNLSSITSEYKFKIAKMEEEKDITSTELKEKIQEVKKLFLNLTILSDKKSHLNFKLIQTQFKREKLDAGIKWLEQDIKVLQVRNDSHDDILCKKLEQKHNFTSRSLSSQKQSDPEQLVLEDELNNLKTENLDWRSQRDLLTEKIKHESELWESQILKLQVIIKSYFNDIKKTKADIETLNKDIIQVIREITVIEEGIFIEDQLIAKDISILKQIKHELFILSSAAACYKKIEEEVLKPYRE